MLLVGDFMTRSPIYLRRPPPPPRDIPPPPRDPPPPYDIVPRLDEPRLLEAREALELDEPP
jgi:hypothetical protein